MPASARPEIRAAASERRTLDTGSGSIGCPAVRLPRSTNTARTRAGRRRQRRRRETIASARLECVRATRARRPDRRIQGRRYGTKPEWRPSRKYSTLWLKRFTNSDGCSTLSASESFGRRHVAHSGPRGFGSVEGKRSVERLPIAALIVELAGCQGVGPPQRPPKPRGTPADHDAGKDSPSPPEQQHERRDQRQVASASRTSPHPSSNAAAMSLPNERRKSETRRRARLLCRARGRARKTRPRS